MKIYIAGPMRGIPFYNFPAFDAAALKLRKAGHYVVSPAELDRNAGLDPLKYGTGRVDWSAIPEGFNFRNCAIGCMMAVIDSDAVYMLKGWEKSTGAQAEWAVARWMGKAVVYQ